MNKALFLKTAGTIFNALFNLLFKKTILLLLISFTLTIGKAQVGINNTNPNATLDITASSVSTPANNDGILIPRVDNFPAINPTIDQEGMMIFATGNGIPAKGFYYWDQDLIDWVLVGGGIDTQNTLDQAYDEGGAGAGKNINATDGSFRIDGDDGFLVTGTFGTGNAIDSEITGTGTRMFFNPRKAAFRAGYAENNRWDDTNIGDYSFAVNRRSLASGIGSISLGYDSEATGNYSFVAGNNSASTANYSFAFGLNSYTNTAIHGFAFGNGSNARDNYSWAIGLSAESFGEHSFAKGFGVTSYSYGETVFGFYNTAYTANSTTVYNPSDRLFVLGNGTVAAQSNALIVYKDGRMNINDSYTLPNNDGTSGQVMTTDGAGQVSFTTISTTDTQNTLDQAYDEGGAGAGRTITADSGAFLVAGNDGFQNTGTFGSGAAIALNGTGTKMFFYPRKAAFRAGDVDGAQWNNVNIGDFSVAMGANTRASGVVATAFGNETVASGNSSTAFGISTTASGVNATAYGSTTTASGNNSTAFGFLNTSSGFGSIAMGHGNTAHSSFETVTGNFSTNYTPIQSTTSTTDPADRLFVLGNGTSNAARSNALTIYKSGLMNINDAYNMPLADGTAGQIITTDGAGQLSFTTISVTDTQNTLDQAYDEGGAGAGRTINATDGVVTIGGEDGLLVTGTFGSGDAINAAGAGTRFFFNPRKAAFRAGIVSGTQWDNANVGNYSVAFGQNNIASDEGSVAFGSNNTVTGYNAVSFGNNNTVPGLAATVFGEQNDASGAFSVAIGSMVTASGETALAVGQSVNANGDASIAMGGNSTANAGSSVVIGNNLYAYSRYESVFGTNSTSYAPNAPNGFNNNDRLFVIGNGASPGTPSDALIILKSGNSRLNGRLGVLRNPATNALEVEGEASKTSAGAFVGNSDRRLKKNIESITGETALEKIEQMRGVTYLWNDDKTGTERPKGIQYGFVAQELMTVFPEKVKKDNLGYYQTAYGDYDAFFVEAIKELKSQVDRLSEENTSLKEKLGKYEMLEDRLSKLEEKSNSDVSKSYSSN